MWFVSLLGNDDGNGISPSHLAGGIQNTWNGCRVIILKHLTAQRILENTCLYINGNHGNNVVETISLLLCVSLLGPCRHHTPSRLTSGRGNPKHLKNICCAVIKALDSLGDVVKHLSIHYWTWETWGGLLPCVVYEPWTIQAYQPPSWEGKGWHETPETAAVWL